MYPHATSHFCDVCVCVSLFINIDNTNELAIVIDQCYFNCNYKHFRCLLNVNLLHIATNDHLYAAVAEVQNGKKNRETAKKYSIPYTTLNDKVNGRVPISRQKSGHLLTYSES